tara:strand:+ start:405 stop:623 length:219 start_codon:yes stop_codon:yes gene_type:complete
MYSDDEEGKGRGEEKKDALKKDFLKEKVKEKGESKAGTVPPRIIFCLYTQEGFSYVLVSISIGSFSHRIKQP